MKRRGCFCALIDSLEQEIHFLVEKCHRKCRKKDVCIKEEKKCEISCKTSEKEL